MQTMICANDGPNFTSHDGPTSCATAIDDLSIYPNSKFHRGPGRPGICFFSHSSSWASASQCQRASGRALLGIRAGSAVASYQKGDRWPDGPPNRKPRDALTTVSIITYGLLYRKWVGTDGNLALLSELRYEVLGEGGARAGFPFILLPRPARAQTPTTTCIKIRRRANGLFVEFYPRGSLSGRSPRCHWFPTVPSRFPTCGRSSSDVLVAAVSFHDAVVAASHQPSIPS